MASMITKLKKEKKKKKPNTKRYQDVKRKKEGEKIPNNQYWWKYLVLAYIN